jgi:hypothetical protein
MPPIRSAIAPPIKSGSENGMVIGWTKLPNSSTSRVDRHQSELRRLAKPSDNSARFSASPDFADADARGMALHDRQLVDRTAAPLSEGWCAPCPQACTRIRPTNRRCRSWPATGPTSPMADARGPIAPRSRRRGAPASRCRDECAALARRDDGPAAGTIMRRNARSPLPDLDTRFSNVETRTTHAPFGVGDDLSNRLESLVRVTTRAANDDHRDVTSPAGAVTPYPLNSSAMLAVMPFAATMSSFPPLRSPVRSLATPRPNSEEAWRGLYRTADS